MDLASNPVVAKSPNYMDLGMSPDNTMDKLKSVIIPTTRVGRPKKGSDWLQPGHDIE